MIRRSTKILLETLAAVALTAIVLAGGLVWRLSSGPISIASVTPYIESALSDPSDGRRVAIGASSLIWDPTDRAIEVRADRVSVFDAGGQAVMVVPEMTLRFHLPALLRGVVVPRTITLVRPSVTVIRAADGGWAFSAVPDTEQGPDGAGAAGDFALDLIEQGLAQLDRFRLLDARIMIEDRRANALWVAPRASLSLQHSRGRFDVEADLELDVERQLVPLRATARLDGNYSVIAGQLTVADLVPAKLARHLVELSDLTALDLPLNGTVRFDQQPAAEQAQLRFDLKGASGQLVRPELPGGVLPVTGMAARGVYRFAKDDLQLDELTVGLPTTSITMSGTARDLGGKTALEGKLAVASLPIDDLRKYWPAEAAPSARRWILANMSQGSVRDLAVHVVLHRDAQDIALDALDGTMTVEGARIVYLKPQPPVEQVGAGIKFDAKHFDIAVTGGRLRGVRVDGGQLIISGLADRDQLIAVDLDLSGPVSDVLALLDLPPFGYVRRYGFTPQAITGDLAGHLSVKHPLIDRLTFDDVALAATAKLRDLRVPKVVRGLDLTDGSFDLNLDNAGMGLMGEGRLAGVLGKLSWIENFVARGAPYRRRYEVAATLSDDDREAVGLALHDNAVGPIGMTLNYTEPRSGPATLLGQFDLGKAALKVGDLSWSKPAGLPGTARIDMRLTEGRLSSLVLAEVSGGGLSFRSSGTFDPAGSLNRLDIQQLKAGDTDIVGRLSWQGDRLDGEFSGRSLDASGMLGGEELDTRAPRPVTLAARLDRVVLGPDRQLGKVDLRAQSDGTKWLSAAISSKVGTGDMRLTLVPRGGGRDLMVTAADAGAVLAAFGLTDDVRGGRLTIDGRYDDEETVNKLKAKIGIEDFRVVHAPLLARLLAVTSITGIPDLLSGDGIGFRELSMQVTKLPGRLEIADGRTSGQALGLTVQGSIEGPDEVTNLNGTVVPFNSVNSMFEKIPLIGDLVTGRGGGVFAFTYSVTGPIDNPSVSVNPLSVLAPGFLRNLFHWRVVPRQDAEPTTSGQ